MMEVLEAALNHYNPPQDSVLNFWAENSTCLDLNDTIVHNSIHIDKWTSWTKFEVHHYITQDGGHCGLEFLTLLMLQI